VPSIIAIIIFLLFFSFLYFVLNHNHISLQYQCDMCNCIIFQDSMDIKATKNFPATLRLVVLVMAATCGLYICSVNLEKPTRVRVNTKLLEQKVINHSCHTSSVEEWEEPYLHYPQPKTYNRYILI